MRFPSKVEAWQQLCQYAQTYYEDPCRMVVVLEGYYNDEYTTLRVERVDVFNRDDQPARRIISEVILKQACESWADPGYWGHKYYNTVEEYVLECCDDSHRAACHRLPVVLGDDAYWIDQVPQDDNGEYVTIKRSFYETLLEASQRSY